MNKKKSPNFLKTGILFFGISLLLFNCEKNENSHEHQEHQIAQIDHLDIEELPEIESALFGLNKVGTSKKNNTQSRSMQTNFGSLKLTNILEYANNDGKLTYSFSIDKEFSENQPYTFENLHLIKLEEGYLGYIIKWEPNHVWLENKNYNFILSDFTGIKTHYDLDYNIIQVTEFINGEPIDYSTSNKTSSKNQTFNRDVEIVCIDFISSLCNGVPYDCGGSICGFGSATFCSLSGSSGSSAENSTPTDSSGTRLPRGGGSSGSINGNAFVVPVIPSPLDLAINSFFNSLTDEEKDFLDNNNLEKEEIKKFLSKKYTPNTSLEDSGVLDNEFSFVRDFLNVAIEIPTAKFKRYEELMELIKDNPFVLLEDCIQQNGLDIANYQQLYDHILPRSCKDRLDGLGVNFQNQPLNTGNAAVANVDYYGVEVTTNPDFNGDGNPDSNADVYQKYREDFGELASGGKDNFQFSCDVPNNSTDTGDITWEFSPYFSQDLTNWNSSNPLTTIFKIEAGANMPGVFDWLTNLSEDDGAIMISAYTPNYWIGSTIATEFSGTQPFSGNRQWGWLINQNNKLELFARAVDIARVSAFTRYNLLAGSPSAECKEDTYYNIGEETWSNLQNEIKQWINDYDGQAEVIPITAIRFDKTKLKELLESNETIDEINCN